MKRFLFSALFILPVVLSVPVKADSPKAWFESRGFDVAACEVDIDVAEPGGAFFSISLVNPFTTDVRLGYWQKSKSRIRIYKSIEPNVPGKWRVQDWDKFYVLDVVNRRCINTLRFVYADEGKTIKLSRGMDEERDPLP